MTRKNSGSAEEARVGWIKVEDGLPSVHHWVIATVKWIAVKENDTQPLLYSGDRWLDVDGDDFAEFGKVIAWQKLPEPFQG